MSRKDSAQFIEECYSLYEQKMYRVAFAILKDPDAAEDAVQDAFLKLMKSGRGDPVSRSGRNSGQQR